MPATHATARLAWFIENAAAASESDLYVYDVIGDPWEGITSADFVKELRGIVADRINLHVNSPGGYVSDALAMFAALQGHPAEVVAYIEGSADSCASFLVQAASKRVIAKNSSMTIHDGHAFAIGPAATFRQLADQLDAESDNIASIYADRAGGTTEEWRARMLATPAGNMGTTYRGQGAVDIGLCDEVGVATRNAVPTKIAALFRPSAITTPAASTPAPSPVIDFAAAMEAARFRSPSPSFQQLLEQHLTEPLTTAFGKGA